MPYIGNTAANRFVASKAASVFSGDGSETQFTLDHSVGSDEDVLVSVDGVIQEPSVAYSVSGTTLTFTAAPSNNSGNNIFVYYLFRTVATVDHPSTSALNATTGTFSGALTGTTGTFSGNVTSSGTITGNAFSGDGAGLSNVGITGWSNNGSNNDLLPASASAGIYLGVNSATASNLLDDYEEGSWTPVLSGVSSHNTQVGKYVRIGNTVTAHAHVNGVVTGSGSIAVSGLPFTSSATTNFQQSIAVGFSSHIAFTSANMLGITARMNSDASEFQLLRYRHNNNGDGVQRSQQGSTAITLLIGGTYITD